MNGFVLFVLMSGAAGLGFVLGGQTCRASRDADDATINGLREALTDTMDALAEANAVKDEAVAAQERADAELKAQFERRSEGSKQSWRTRKAKVRDEVADVA